MLTAFKQPVIFAHRGASAYAPENTLAAFRLAVEQGADAIELDAKLSKDKEVVVIHDQTVDRTTNGSGEVKRLTLEELRRLEAGSFFADRFSMERIPSLSEVFEAVGGKIFINIELTNYASPNDSLPERVAELVQRYQLEKFVLFSSFQPFNLIRVRNLLPECPVGLLALGGMPGVLARSFILRWVSPTLLHPYLGNVTAAFIKREHARGRRVHVWTVNDRVDLANLFSWGVDGVFTDDPPLALAIRGER